MRVPISSLIDKMAIDSTYLVKSRSVLIAKNGKPYLNIILMDSTGEIIARVWEDAEEIAALFDRGDVIQVTGHVNLYQGKLQLILQDIIKVPKESINAGDFLPVSSRNIDEMMDELSSYIKSLKNPYLKKLSDRIFSNKTIVEKFKKSPAATGVHHVYIGGLLQHVLSLCALVKVIVPLYKNLNRDLLISACFYHDIGKILELSCDTSFEYTDEVKFLGHLVQGTILIESEINKIEGFPVPLRNALLHIILSHHGEYEFGSPKRPKFLEAIVFHFLDNLDSVTQIPGTVHLTRWENTTHTLGFQTPRERKIDAINIIGTYEPTGSGQFELIVTISSKVPAVAQVVRMRLMGSTWFRLQEVP